MNDSDQAATSLPASLEAAWGVRDRPGRSVHRGLRLDRVVRAGVEIADSAGLSAVSMSRVAAELGVSTMAPYRYVATKDELLTLMVDHAFGPPPEPAPGDSWQQELAGWARRMRDTLRRHPWVRQIPAEAPPLEPNQIAWLESALRCLRSTGLTGSEKLSTVMLLAEFVRNEAVWGPAESSNDEATHNRRAYGDALARLVDRQQLPEVAELIDTGTLHEADHPDAEFDFGLRRILSGIAELVRMRS